MSLLVQNMGCYQLNLLSMHHQMDFWAVSDLIQSIKLGEGFR